MGGLWRNEKSARRVALGAGLPLLLLLLPMLLVIGAKGTSDIQDESQAVRTTSAQNANNNMDNHLRPTASVKIGAGGEDHPPPPRRALSTNTNTNPLDEESDTEKGYGVPFTKTRFVFEGGFDWLDELSAPPQQASLLEAAAATTAAAVGGSVSDPQSRQRGTRGLTVQTAACSPGDTFSLVSTVHAGAGGCYFVGAKDTNAYLTIDQDRIVLPASISSASSSTTETFAWVAGKVLGFSGGALDVDPECVSDEPWTVNSHPTDAGSWSCLVGGTLVAFSQESFGIECGCSGGSSDTAGAGSTPASSAYGNNAPNSATNPSPAGVGLSCDAASITITSPLLDGFEGCYTDPGGVNGTVGSHYGQTSELGGGSGVNAVFSAPIDERGHDVRWVAGTYVNMSTDSGIVPTCITDDNATSVHPADSTWLCDLTGTGAFMPVNETHFQIDCGCNSTSPAPTPSPNAEAVAAVEAGANGGSRSCAASGGFSLFGVTGLLAALVGLIGHLFFVGE